MWVSEIMLQQTRVAAAIPYYERFMARFPDVGALARAPLDAVMKAWEGMGYYGRARNLHAAARVVASEYGGRLPASAGELRKLPGVGRYTAGAIASIAFGADEPVLDGNVTRVLCRVFVIAADPRASRTRKRLWTLAEAMIPPGEAGLVNQAMMDLGATVCLPTNPRCGDCPLAGLCLARLRGHQGRYPRKAARKPLPHQVAAVGAVVWRGRILIARRRPEGLLGGLWELPGGKVRPWEDPADAVVREVREETGVEAAVEAKVMVAAQAYSHLRVTLHVFRCRRVSGTARPIASDAVRWVRLDQLDRYAFPAVNRRIFATLHNAASGRNERNQEPGTGNRG